MRTDVIANDSFPTALSTIWGELGELSVAGFTRKAWAK